MKVSLLAAAALQIAGDGSVKPGLQRTQSTTAHYYAPHDLGYSHSHPLAQHLRLEL